MREFVFKKMAMNSIKQIPGNSFSEKERICEFIFNNAVREIGPFWHICTPGDFQEIVFTKQEDFIFGVNNMAISAIESGIMIVTDSVMDNHIHSLAAGTAERCITFVKSFKNRLARFLAAEGRFLDLSGFCCTDPILVEDLNMARNEIVYINRNGYVASSFHTPFSYPWGAGSSYFNSSMNSGTPYRDLPYREKRRITNSRIMDLPSGYSVSNGMILPSSYANVRLGESFFRDAHHYFNLLTRNFEAYSAEAKRLGDKIILTDEEMYPVARSISLQRYNQKQPSLLSPAWKIEVAKVLHNDYHATNAQIHRILKLSNETVNALWPLSSKR